MKIDAGVISGNAYALILNATGSVASIALSASNGHIIGTVFSGSIFSGSFSGSLFGTSSFANTSSNVIGTVNSSSYAFSASYATIVPTQSTASYSNTASYIINAQSASYISIAQNGYKAFAYMTMAGTVLTSSLSSSCNVSRSAAGLYYVTLTPSFPSSFYHVSTDIFSGSVTGITANLSASVANVFNKLTNSFTMSVIKNQSAPVRTDFTTGSFIVTSLQ